MSSPEPARPVASVQIRWFVDDDGALRHVVDLDPVATELHERHRLWLATELTRISRGIVEDIRRRSGRAADGSGPCP